MASLYRAALEKKNLDGTPIKVAVADALVDKAMQGDVIAIKELNNRIDGMAKQSVEVTEYHKVLVDVPGVESEDGEGN